MIHDGEVVTALAEVGASDVSLPPTVVLSSSKTSHASVVSQDDPGRLQIRLVTAELARKHARATPKDKSEPTTGVLAFEGEFVSGNTSLVSIGYTLFCTFLSSYHPFGSETSRKKRSVFSAGRAPISKMKDVTMRKRPFVAALSPRK